MDEKQPPSTGQPTPNAAQNPPSYVPAPNTFPAVSNVSAPPGVGYPQPPPPQGQPLYYGAPPPMVNVPPMQQAVVCQMKLGSIPVTICCPNCRQNVVTKLEYETGMLTWISMGVLCLIGGILFVWIPLLINELKDVIHVCPNCNFRCGKYERLS